MSSTLDLLQAPSLTALAWLRHAFSTRPGGVSTPYGRPGDLNLGFTPEDAPQAVEENRRRLLTAVTGTAAFPLVTTRQVHGSRTLHIQSPQPAPLEPADGLITALPGIALAMLTADCVPVLLADPRHRAVAVLHAGWRGTAACIVEQAIAAMTQAFHSDPKHLIAAIGPSIGPCCYTVGDEVRTSFQAAFPYADSLFQATHLDLWQANRRQLLAAGLPAPNITTLAQCTACTLADGHRRFFSYRADNAVTGRMLSVIGIAPGHPIP